MFLLHHGTPKKAAKTPHFCIFHCLTAPKQNPLEMSGFCRKKNGAASPTEMRTHFGIKCVLGVPLPQYNLSPFAAAPFRFTWSPQEDVGGPTADTEEEDSGLRHPICKVLEWDRRLQTEDNLTRAQLAREEGTTKAYVTQMLRLMNLPEEARQYLSGLRSPETIRSFSLRRLAMVAKLPADRRREAFDAMKTISSRSGS